MKKYFCVSDIHGYYTELRTALNNAGFQNENPDHIIISMGDLLDRGREPMQCLEFMNKLYDANRAILITGNHEDLMQKMIARREPYSHDVSNGTFQTLSDLTYYNYDTGNLDLYFNRMKSHVQYNKYISRTINYYETNNYIFVHGWIPCDRDDPNIYHSKDVTYNFNPDWRNGDWESARWINGMNAWSQNVKVDNKTIVCGHWHTSWGHTHLHNEGNEWKKGAIFTPFVDNGIVAIDACTAISKFVNVYTIDEDLI